MTVGEKISDIFLLPIGVFLIGMGWKTLKL